MKLLNIELINKELKKSGLSKKTLAGRMNISRQTLYRRLHYPEKLKLGELKIIADAIDVNIIDLFEGRDSSED